MRLSRTPADEGQQEQLLLVVVDQGRLALITQERHMQTAPSNATRSERDMRAVFRE